MKTITNFLFFILMSMIFVQCSKNEDIKTTSSSTSQMSAYDLKINNMVSGFKTKLNSNLKSGETMSTDSALWYISTTLNATYASSYHNGQAPGKTYIDSLTVSLPENNGTLTLYQINLLYDRILDSAKAIYHLRADADKQLAAVIFDPQSGNSEVDITLVTYSTWGLQWWEQFGPSESYFFSWGDVYGNLIQPNACQKFEDKFAWHVYGNPYLAPYPGYFWIPTNEVPIEANQEYPYNVNPNVAPYYTNYLDYYTFQNRTYIPNFHDVLCSDELNFYLSKIIELADVIIPQKNNITITATHRCYVVEMSSGFFCCGNPPTPQNINRIFQSFILQYGDRVTRPIPPDDF